VNAAAEGGPGWWGRKVAALPAEGVALVATDLQGNLADFRALLQLHRRELDAGRRAWLVLCGDLVHGPPPDLTQERWPDHLGSYYADESATLLLEAMEYARDHDVIYLLGNHEHAHVGGPVVSKFHDDEAAVLENSLGPDCARAVEFLAGLPLLAIAPCGVVCCHGAPRATERSLPAFDALTYDGYQDVQPWQMIDVGTLGALLWARAATTAHAESLLAVAHGEPRGFVTYGHDIVREGYECVDARQLCLSTSFGLHDHAKTYLRLELDRRYDDTGALRPGHELLPLYPGATA
jgi:hypothetical protein